MLFTNDPRLQLQLWPKCVKRLNETQLRDPFTAPWRFDGYIDRDEANDGIQALKRLGLGIYAHQLGYYMVGFTNTQQHPHDRWLFRTNVPITPRGRREAKPTWVELKLEQDARQDTLGEQVENLVDTLEYTDSWMRSATLVPGMTRREALHQYMILGEETFIRLNHRRLLKVGTDYRQAHDMLIHYAMWLRRHPEFKDLPRDIVLRMHGLGGLLDAGYKLPSA